MIHSNRRALLVGSILVISITLLLLLLLFVFLSKSPVESMHAFFFRPFSSRFALGNLINAATSLMFTGLGISLCFRAGIFNLGGEGQTYAGAFVAAWIALQLPPLLEFLGPAQTSTAIGRLLPIVIVVLAGMIAGLLVASVSALLKWLAGIDELLSTFLVAKAITPLIDHAIGGPFRDETSYLLTTPKIPHLTRLSSLLPPSHLNAAFFVAVALVAGAAFYLFRSRWGYEHRVFGLNREFAQFGGISLSAYAVFPLLAGGALCGAAGAFSVAGTHYACIQGMTSGMGWNGIAVALIAGTNPIAVIPAALIFAYLQAGSQAAMLYTDFSFEAGAFIQALVLLLITARFIQSRTRRRTEVEAT